MLGQNFGSPVDKGDFFGRLHDLFHPARQAQRPLRKHLRLSKGSGGGNGEWENTDGMDMMDEYQLYSVPNIIEVIFRQLFNQQVSTGALAKASIWIPANLLYFVFCTRP